VLRDLICTPSLARILFGAELEERLCGAWGVQFHKNLIESWALRCGLCPASLHKPGEGLCKISWQLRAFCILDHVKYDPGGVDITLTVPPVRRFKRNLACYELEEHHPI